MVACTRPGFSNPAQNGLHKAKGVSGRVTVWPAQGLACTRPGLYKARVVSGRPAELVSEINPDIGTRLSCRIDFFNPGLVALEIEFFNLQYWFFNISINIGWIVGD